MSLLRVDPLGLKCLANACTSWSAEVAATGTPSAADGSIQATAAAVNTVHAQAESAGSMLSARLIAIAAGLSMAASAHTAREAAATTAIDDLGR